MVFEGEDTILEEDILKKKIEFVKSWVEWVAENELQILRSGNNISGVNIIYTVPARRTFYLTSCSIVVTNIVDNSVNSNIGLFSLRQGLIVRVHTQNAAAAGDTGDPTSTKYGFSQTFPMPIRLEEGDNLQITNSTGIISASIQGFEIAKKISP